MSDNRSLYFQTIARDFLERRGAPFFLSAKELALIEEWEKEGIPLRIVREGISNFFSSPPARKGSGKKKRYSLSFCASSVQRAYAMYKDRGVGKDSAIIRAEDKKKAVGEAAARFVMNIPARIHWLEAPYRKVLDMLPDCSDDDLEKMEEKVEDLLFLNARREDVEEAEKVLACEYPSSGFREDSELLRIILVKLMRKKHKIPHIAPFHY